MTNPSPEGGLYDLILLTDATGSMSSFLDALRQCLPDIIRVSSLTDCFSRIGVLAYRDYGRCTDYDNLLTQWSGWHAPGDKDLSEISQSDLIAFAGQVLPRLGGGAEAAKTGLAKAHSVMRPEATTIIVFFADQPPHLSWEVSTDRELEISHLSKLDSYGGSGPLFLDWISAARTLATGDRRARVFAYIDTKHATETLTSFLYLCNTTGGTCFQLNGYQSGAIMAGAVINILLSWMGLSKNDAPDPGDSLNTFGPVLATSFDWADPMMASIIRKEEDDQCLFLFRQTGVTTSVLRGTNVESQDQFRFFITPREPPLQDLSKRYEADPSYRAFAIVQLNQIIEADVCAITTNPVFGTLWRAVSRDRSNPARDVLLANFGFQVENISHPASRARMTAWLDESYNFREAIAALIRTVPDAEQFPCVYLDPTQDFSSIVDDADDSGTADIRDPTKFTRAELLEIGRSCDPRILRRLGKVLTRLSFADDEDSVPVHIRESSPEDVPRIPMALATEQHSRHLWKVLLHLILPGTRITARPAALLAALSNRMGMLPLRAAADEELSSYSGHWGSREVPETWNTSCMSLLLDADQDYEKRVANGTTIRPTPDACVLRGEDRQLFKTLVDYKMLEFNLNTTLTAKVGWAPDKTKVAAGPLAICVRCRLPRSVTIMGAKGVCGLCEGKPGCVCDACKITPENELRKHVNASESDNELTEMAWVECSISSCRSQYVVYNVAQLNVRPKCFYCRHSDTVGWPPYVECSQCLSRIIWPVEYRPKEVELAEYRCTGCTTGRATIVALDTSAKELASENGQDWLVRDESKVIRELFNGRSIFNTIKSVDLQALASKVTILPRHDGLCLTVHGKLVRNAGDILASLGDWVLRRQSEMGTCSLCFSESRKTDLRSACGRKGCLSVVCNTCRHGWYGLNAPGKIINLAALCCPFCRRVPNPRNVPREVVQIGGLSEAAADKAWIYAWCNGCGFAKRLMERVCANGAPEEVEGWRCEACVVPGAEVEQLRHCPGCKTATIKSWGCNHMTCPCGMHWCYKCGEASSEGEIYKHMAEAHGGFYGRDGEDVDDFDDFDDEEDW
jgi:hypothetical protein